jgi:hypothetical protein
VFLCYNIDGGFLMSILDALYTHHNQLFSVSLNPEDDKDYCVWMGDSFVTASESLETAIQLCNHYAAQWDRRNKNREDYYDA